MKVAKCNSCHHMPSCRYGSAGLQCYCKCHDIADLGPRLLEALRAILKLYVQELDTEADELLSEIDEIEGR